MATSRESITVQVAGVDGAPGSTPSSEAPLVSEHDSGRTTGMAFLVSLSVPALPSGLHLAQLGMPSLLSVRGVGADGILFFCFFSFFYRLIHVYKVFSSFKIFIFFVFG